MAQETSESGASAPLTADDVAKLVADVLEEQKAEDLVVLKMTEVLPLTDYFVIATGRSARHVDSMVELLELRLKKEKIPVRGRSGREANWWVLLDVGPVVVHVFQEEARKYYDLEMLWGDAERVR